MARDDRPHEREAQAAPFHAHRAAPPVELLAEVREFVGWNARPGVRHLYGDARSVLVGADFDRRALCAELERVVDQWSLLQWILV